MAVFAPLGNIIQSLQNKDPQCTTGKCVGAVEINGECYSASGSIKEFPYSTFIMFINRTDSPIGLTVRKQYTSGPAVGQCTTRVAYVPACGSSNTFIPYSANICMIWEQIEDNELPKYLKGCDLCLNATVSFEKFELNPWPGEYVPEHIKSSLEDILNKSYDIELEGDEIIANGEITLDPINIAPYLLSSPPGGAPAPGNEAPYGDIWTPTISIVVNTNDKTISVNFYISSSVNIFGVGGPLSLSLLQSIDGNNSQVVSQVSSVGGWISLYDSYLPGYPPLEGFIDFSESTVNVSIPYKWSQLL